MILGSAISRVSTLIERKFRVSITRNPRIKYYADFIERANLALISQSKGILHIGGHLGLEAKTYNDLGKKAIFIEADPDIFKELERNVSQLNNQQTHNILLGDSHKVVKFFRSSNNSESSSVFPFSRKNRLTNLTTDLIRELPMKRLDSCFDREQLQEFDHWIVDVQGAELLVLNGAGHLLDVCRTIYIECSTTEFYEGGVLWDELCQFLKNAGFKYFIFPADISHFNALFFRA